MATAVTPNKVWYDGKKIWVVATVVLSGNYVSGGDTLNLAGIAPGVAKLPIMSDIQSLASTAAQALNTYTFVPGATLATCKMRCFIGAAAELAAGAYPAAATGDTIQLQLTFER